MGGLDSGKYIMRPTMILGENKDIFLNYLDKHLVNTSKKSRYFFYGSGALFLTHFFIYKYSSLKNYYK